MTGRWGQVKDLLLEGGQRRRRAVADHLIRWRCETRREEGSAGRICFSYQCLGTAELANIVQCVTGHFLSVGYRLSHWLPPTMRPKCYVVTSVMLRKDIRPAIGQTALQRIQHHHGLDGSGINLSITSFRTTAPVLRGAGSRTSVSLYRPCQGGRRVARRPTSPCPLEPRGLALQPLPGHRAT